MRSTAPLLKAISQASGWHIIEHLLEKEQMPELRGMLLPFPCYSDFLRFIEGRDPVLSAYKDQVPSGAKVAIILVSEINNTCWRRFSIIKEASHLFIEGDDLCAHADVDLLISSLLKSSSSSSGEILPEESAYIKREAAGIAAALELLMPSDCLKSWAARKINVEGQTPKDIAKRLIIPLRFVEIRLQQWTL